MARSSTPRTTATSPSRSNKASAKSSPGFDNCREGLRAGGKRRLLTLCQLAYCAKIPPKSELIFDIELLDALDPPPAPSPVQ